MFKIVTEEYKSRVLSQGYEADTERHLHGSELGLGLPHKGSKDRGQAPRGAPLGSAGPNPICPGPQGRRERRGLSAGRGHGGRRPEQPALLCPGDRSRARLRAAF